MPKKLTNSERGERGERGERTAHDPITGLELEPTRPSKRGVGKPPIDESDLTIIGSIPQPGDIPMADMMHRHVAIDYGEPAIQTAWAQFIGLFGKSIRRGMGPKMYFTKGDLQIIFEVWLLMVKEGKVRSWDNQSSAIKAMLWDFHRLLYGKDGEAKQLQGERHDETA